MNIQLSNNFHLWTFGLDPSICHSQRCYISLLWECILFGECGSLLAGGHSLTASTETVKFWFIIFSWAGGTVHCQTQRFVWIKGMNQLVPVGKRHFCITVIFCELAHKHKQTNLLRAMMRSELNHKRETKIILERQLNQRRVRYMTLSDVKLNCLITSPWTNLFRSERKNVTHNFCLCAWRQDNI